MEVFELIHCIMFWLVLMNDITWLSCLDCAMNCCGYLHVFFLAWDKNHAIP